jgi:hypothetical protein
LKRYLHVTGDRATPNSNHIQDGILALKGQCENWRDTTTIQHFWQIVPKRLGGTLVELLS